MKHSDASPYDEFSLLATYAAMACSPPRPIPSVARHEYIFEDDHALSAVVWGASTPELLLLHGMGQNAHTWDRVALALDRPLIAVDLPGHGHSDWREDHDYRPQTNAKAIVALLSCLDRPVRAVIGASLGGLTAICAAALAPAFVPRLAVVDITPAAGSRRDPEVERNAGFVGLLAGPATFQSFDAMLEAVGRALPDRPPESLRVGVRHNARQLEDGRWAWRYDREHAGVSPLRDRERIWRDLASLRIPVALIRGGKSWVVKHEDEDQFVRLRPNTRIYRVEGAGHSVQSDRPAELAQIIEELIGVRAVRKR